MGAMHFEFVEALTVYAYDVGLGYKGMRVNLVDDAEDYFAFTPLGHDEEHLHLMPSVEAASLDERGTPVGIDSYAAGYLLIFVGDDEKLHAASHGTYHLVDAETGHQQHHVAVDDFFPIVEYKVGGGDDDYVAEHDDTA